MSLLKVAGTTASSGTLYVDDVFSTWLYTGTGAAQTITNGIDLAGKGGLVWVKSRSAATDHKLTDTVRGATKALISDTTGAETTDSTGLTAFSSTGFSLGANSVYNTNAATYASWTFRKAAKFFDVVTYTGTGSARTIAHSLGVAPGMIIVKRTDTTGNWQVYSNGMTSAAYSMQLNLSAAQASASTVWNSTAPTSSVFSVGTDATVNASGGTYVAYLFAHDTSSTGIIQCGSFTTDGSGNATVNLGWEPQYLLYKATTIAEGWGVLDSMRGFPVGSNAAMLRLNTSAAEISAAFPSPSATGFYGSALTNLTNSTTYIYMAIRMPNKPPTTGTQVFLPVQLSGSDAPGTKKVTGFPVDLQLYSYPAGGGTIWPGDVDRLRGVSTNSTEQGNYLLTFATDAEDSTYTVSNSWSNTGFSAANALSYANFITWNFKRAPGFFDEVCYTGTGATTSQAHNLTVVPELMIVKVRSATQNWWVYVSSVGNTKYSILNSTAIPTTSSTAWNNTTPTASVFSIGTSDAVNASSQTFVAYLFATLAGISKVGSYTGNGTGQAIACGFGSGGARFVLIKRTDSTGDWYTFDSARGLTSGSSPYLLLNSSVAQVTGNNGVYASSGGFTLGATAITTTNIATATYIFLAVA